MKVFLVDWSSEGNQESGTIAVQARSVLEAQDKFWDWLREQSIYAHLWRLSFSIEESQLI